MKKMEDQVELKGQRFRVVTETSKDGKIHTKIIKVSDDKEEDPTLFQRFIDSEDTVKDKLADFQQKALYFLFGVLNKEDNPTEESFEKVFEKDDNELNNYYSHKEKNDGLELIEDESFSKICKDLLTSKEIACFFIKGDNVLFYFNEDKDSEYSKEELAHKVPKIINFVKKNHKIKRLIGSWNFILYSEKEFNIFASLLGDDKEIFVLVNDPSIPMGYMLKNSERIKDKFLEFSYLF